MSQIKIIFTRGIQGSGKSTWAKQFVKENQDYKRICRDDLRHMLSSYTFDNENEDIVSKIEGKIINEFLIENKYNLIIDSMNLNEPKLNERIEKYKSYSNPIVEIKDFPITLEEAIERNKKRDFVIGEKVIWNTWNRNKNILTKMLENKYPKPEYNPALSDCIICDIDGTLAIRGDRSPYDFSRIKEDIINEPIRDLINLLGKNKILFIVSGRDDICYDDTMEWLVKNGVNKFADIYMRKTGDKRKDSIVKKEIYEQHIKDKYNCIYVVDDRKQVVDMWRNELGLTVLDVAGHNF